MDLKLFLSRGTAFFMSAALPLLFGCKQERSSMPNPPLPMVVRLPGDYPSPTGKLRLLVTMSPSDTVSYAIEEKGSSRVLARGNCGSKFQRWFLLWDSEENLWVHSSDVGTLVLRQEEDGAFRKEGLTIDAPPPTDMPAAFWSELPQSLRSAWKRSPP